MRFKLLVTGLLVALLAVMSATLLVADRAADEAVAADNEGWPFVYVFNAKNQRLPSHTTRVFRFTAPRENADRDNMFDPAHPSYFRTPSWVDGVYLVTWQVDMSWPHGRGHTSLYIEEDNGRGWKRRAELRVANPPTGDAEVCLSTVFCVDRGDRVRFLVRQTSGRTLTIKAGDWAPKASMTMLRPQYTNR